MKRFLLFAPLLFAACTQSPAPVDYLGNRFNGPNGVYDNRGTELPKYSASNPAPMEPTQAQKYQDSQNYGSPAEIGSVTSSDLPPPTAKSSPPGEIRVPASNAPQTQALSLASGATSAPFSSGTPAPAVVVPSAAQQVDTSMAAPTESLSTSKPRISASTAATPPPPLEPDYYEQEATAATTAPAKVVPTPKATAPNSSEVAMMNSDETAPTAASPAPVSNQPEFIWPVKGEVLSGFGNKSGGKTNDGVNIKGMKGDPIRASADGKVTYAGDDVKSFGNMVIIDHGHGWVTNYAHASELVVKKGENVVKGQLLGFVGTSGGVPSPQVHFSIRHNNAPTDPKSLLVAD